MEDKKRRRTKFKIARSLRNLFLTCFGVLFGSLVFATEVDFFISTYEARINEPFLVTLTVRNVEPAYVSFLVEKDPAVFSLSSTKKEATNISLSGRQIVPATVFTQELIPRELGLHELGPFKILCDTEEILLPLVYIQVKDKEEKQNVQVFWVNSKNVYEVGLSSDLILMGTKDIRFISVQVPLSEYGVLEKVETSGLAELDPENQILAQYRWTPIREGLLSLPLATVEYKNGFGLSSFVTSKEQKVRVLPFQEKSAPLSKNNHVASAFVKVAKKEVSDSKPISDNTEYELVKTLFDLRKKEHESLAFFKYRAQRIKIERENGLSENPKVQAGAWKLPLAFVFLLCCLIALFFGLVSPLDKKKKYKKYSLFTLCFAILFACIVVNLYIKDMHAQAVVTSVTLSQVPEKGSETIEILRAGSVVTVFKVIGDWASVQSPTKVKGWVPLNTLWVYSKQENLGL